MDIKDVYNKYKTYQGVKSACEKHWSKEDRHPNIYSLSLKLQQSRLDIDNAIKEMRSQFKIVKE